MIATVIKVFFPTGLAFIVGILFSPIWTHYLYKYKLWKKKSGKMLRNGDQAEIFNELHKDKDTGTPRMGGVVIIVSVIVVAVLIWILAHTIDGSFSKLDFISRDQTWIPLVTLLFGAIVGLIDDILEIQGTTNGGVGGLSLKTQKSKTHKTPILTAPLKIKAKLRWRIFFISREGSVVIKNSV